MPLVKRGLFGALTAAAVLGSAVTAATAGPESGNQSDTATPIKHVLVVFQENVSFDHYFATYPKAANPKGEPAFQASPDTPSVAGLNGPLLTHNPNSVQPFRLGRDKALTCDQDHDYTAEQKAYGSGAVDKYVENTSSDACKAPGYGQKGLVMGYYDGNTVTGMWNYAQRFAMSDNSFNTTYGPSTPGALNVISGQTHGATAYDKAGNPVEDSYAAVETDANHVGTVINDPDPVYDDCSNPTHNHIGMQGRNIGDVLNAKNVTWGAFMGGFAPTTPAQNGQPAQCSSKHDNIGGAAVTDYIPHHAWFEYYKSTSNQHHVAPASLDEIGHNGQANHNYDLSYLDKAIDGGKLPSVSYVKASAYQDGHAGYSDPLDEQKFVVDLVNEVQSSQYWKDTAVVLAYDDSDGWYDHVMPPVVNASQSSHDALTGTGVCGSGKPLGGQQARCGYGPRLPLMVISPFAKRNAVDHSLTDQTSVLKFVEDNWKTGTVEQASFDTIAGSMDGLFDFKHPNDRRLILDPATGQPKRGDGEN
jgi:phospholipase C